MKPHGWERRLQEYVDSIRGSPFEFVHHNCALFAAGAIRAMTGNNPVERLGLSIKTQGDVGAVLSRFGGVVGICREYFESEMQPRRLARRGDVVIKPGLDGDTVGVCMGDHALFLGPDGLQARQLTECVGCWRVE